MTTHYMDEAENCDRVAIMDHGQIVALDSPSELKALVGGDLVTVWTSDNEAALEKLASAEVDARFGPGQELILEVSKGDVFIPRMMQLLVNGSQPIEVQSVSLRRPTLEDVFIKLTGRTIREDEASATERMGMRMRRTRGH
jgi:ABC-2 type transport system ATP-binding protein